MSADENTTPEPEEIPAGAEAAPGTPVSVRAERGARMTPAEAVRDMRIKVPARGNRILRELVERVNRDDSIKALWHAANVNAVARMQIKLEQVKAIWFQAITEARANPTKEQVLRAYAAQYSAMEGANEIATLAIRTCGGQAMLKSLPLERIYRDSRCGSLMLPWTAELCLDRIGREALYETGESDE